MPGANLLLPFGAICYRHIHDTSTVPLRLLQCSHSEFDFVFHPVVYKTLKQQAAVDRVTRSVHMIRTPRRSSHSREVI
jgi:hypothetical protein